MIQLAPQQIAFLDDTFLISQPGPQTALHVLHTGHGACFADRRSGPRALLADVAGNYTLSGDPAALQPDDIRPHIQGFVEAGVAFLPLLQATFPALTTWERLILELQQAPLPLSPSTAVVRRLTAVDAYHLWGLSPDINWISKSWGGPEGLAKSGYAWGAFEQDRLVAVACTFFLGIRYEDIGVVTDEAFRGRGLSLACAAALCGDVRARGHRPSWTTSPDNTASLRVAEKLGFSLQRRDVLYVIGTSVPESAQPPAG